MMSTLGFIRRGKKGGRGKAGKLEKESRLTVIRDWMEVNEE